MLKSIAFAEKVLRDKGICTLSIIITLHDGKLEAEDADNLYYDIEAITSANQFFASNKGKKLAWYCRQLDKRERRQETRRRY